MRFEFGDIVLVPFPFTSQAASKKRPAVVMRFAMSSRALSDDDRVHRHRAAGDA
jgi:hypothetical protein